MSLLVVYAGGTIGMSVGAAVASGDISLRPDRAFADALRSMLQQMSGDPVPDVEVISVADPADSARFGPAQWNEIGQILALNLDRHDGAVVLHGTDTLAWTASALAFALSGLNKPVVVTGAQVPLGVARSDASLNLLAAVRVAADPGLREVVVCFGSRVLRGVRSTKVDADGYDAFASPSDVPLGSIGAELRLYRERFMSAAPGPLRFRRFRPVTVAQLLVTPLQPPAMLSAVLTQNPAGILLELYGVGTAPIDQPGFLEGLDEARAARIPVVAVSSSSQAVVDLGRYEVGKALFERGVISGRDMTAEAAATKLAHLLSMDLDYGQLCRAMGTDSRGELTPLYP